MWASMFLYKHPLILKIAIFLMALTLAPLGFAQDRSTANKYSPLTNLRNMQIETPLAADGRPKLVMFMQPDCKWCKKQAKDLEAIAQACEAHVNISILGFKGSKSDLRREARHYSNELPVFYADKHHIQQFGGIKSSPTFVFINGQQQTLAKQLGYLMPDKLFAAVRLLSNGMCTLDE